MCKYAVGRSFGVGRLPQGVHLGQTLTIFIINSLSKIGAFHSVVELVWQLTKRS